LFLNTANIAFSIKDETYYFATIFPVVKPVWGNWSEGDPHFHSPLYKILQAGDFSRQRVFTFMNYILHHHHHHVYFMR